MLSISIDSLVGDFMPGTRLQQIGAALWPPLRESWATQICLQDLTDNVHLTRMAFSLYSVWKALTSNKTKSDEL